MTIIVDTREPGDGRSHPWAACWPADVRVVRGTLETGDVALAALPDGAVIERKTVPDFLAAVGRERKRFDLELKRARYCGSFVIIVEGTFGDVLAANHARGFMNAQPKTVAEAAYCELLAMPMPKTERDSRRAIVMAALVGRQIEADFAATTLFSEQQTTNKPDAQTPTR